MFVRAFYPVLVRPEQSHGEEVASLNRLEFRSSICFYLTIAAPFFALFLLIAFKTQQTDTQNGWSIALIIIGVLDSIFAGLILQTIRIGDLGIAAVPCEVFAEIAKNHMRVGNLNQIFPGYQVSTANFKGLIRS